MRVERLHALQLERRQNSGVQTVISGKTTDRCFIRAEQFGHYCPKCTARWDRDEEPVCVRQDRTAPSLQPEPFASGLPFESNLS
jgi:hypothetical protein